MAKSKVPEPAALIAFLAEMLDSQARHLATLADAEEQTGIHTTQVLEINQPEPLEQLVGVMSQNQAGRFFQMLVFFLRLADAEGVMKLNAAQKRKLANQIRDAVSEARVETK